jgi:hypothetical protein
MAAPIDFKHVRLTKTDEQQGRASMREMHGRNWWRKRGRATWAGFAAEHALYRSINLAPNEQWAELAPTYDYDLKLCMWRKKPDGEDVAAFIPVEVKTRCVLRGWVHPDKFDYITVPMHDGREPIKVGEDGLVVFCWYSMDDRRRLWALGYVRGLEEFKRRSTWYEEGAPLPRGGWARDGGAYVIEVKQLRPLPDELLLEAPWNK